jgi:hypothetical protein
MTMLGQRPWTPRDITTAVWYDSADLSTITASGGFVSNWADKSGNENDATQGSGGTQPETGTRTINGLNVLDFDGTDDVMSLTSGVDLVGKLFFIVIEKDVAKLQMLFGNAVINTQLRIKGFDQSLEYASLAPYWPNNTKTTTVIAEASPTICGFIGDSSLQFSINGTVENSETGNNGSGATVYDLIGFGTGANPFDGKIAEIIMVDSLDPDVRQRIEGYLAWKWGLESELPYEHPYKFEKPSQGTTPRAWLPSDITTAAWYDAADTDTITESSGDVSQWDDKSGNNNHITQGSSSLQPTHLGDSIDFVSGQNLIKSSASNVLNANGKCSLFMVHDLLDPSTSSQLFIQIFSNNSTAGGDLERRPRSFYAKAADTFNIGTAEAVAGAISDISTKTGLGVISYYTDDTDEYVYLNGAFEGTHTVVLDSTTTSSSLRVGDLNNQNLTITHREIILIADEISTETRQRIEGYLAWKWGLESELPYGHPYKNGAPLNNGSVVSPPNWTPELIGTEIWHDASDLSTITQTTGSVSQWDDKSGNGHTVQGDGSQQPQTGVRTQNGLNGLYFQEDFMSAAGITRPANGNLITVGVVNVELANQTSESIWSFDGASSDYQFDASQSSGFEGTLDTSANDSPRFIPAIGYGVCLLSAVLDWGANQVYGRKNGSLQTTVGSYNTILDSTLTFNLSCNRNKSRRIESSIFEIVTIDDISNLEIVEGYLAWKWGLVDDLPVDHPFKLLPPLA